MLRNTTKGTCYHQNTRKMIVMVVMMILVIVKMTLIVKILHKAKGKPQKLLAIFKQSQEEHQNQRPELLTSAKARLMTTEVLAMTVTMIVRTMKIGMQDMREMVLTVNSI